MSVQTPRPESVTEDDDNAPLLGIKFALVAGAAGIGLGMALIWLNACWTGDFTGVSC